MQYYGFDPYLSDLHNLTSTIGQKNWISNYLAMIFPIGFSYFLLEQIKKNKIIYFFLLSILYTTLMICQSRGIWISISLTLMLAIYIIFKFKLLKVFKENKKWLVLLLITFLVITVIYSTNNPLNKSALTVPQRALSTFDENDPSINTRLLIWRTTIEMIKDKPLFGLGIGTFKYHYLDYQAEYLQNNPNYIKNSGKAAEAHNEYLQMAAEIGLVGLLIFLAVIFLFYFSIYQYLKKSVKKEGMIIIFGLVMAITCFLIHSMFTFPFHVPVLGSTFFIFLGLAVVYMRITGINRNENQKDDLYTMKLNINKVVRYITLSLLFLLVILFTVKFAVNPYLAEINYMKGTKYFQDQDYNIALEYFEKAVTYDVYNGRLLHALGSTYYQLDIQEKAQMVLEKTKQIYNDRNTYRNLGLSFMQSGDIKAAKKEFQHAIYLDPRFYKAYNDLASLYVYQKEYKKAIEQWEKAINLGLDFKEKYIFLYYIGIAYQRMDDSENAYDYFLEALELVPEGNPIEKEIEEEINKIYKSKLEN